MLKHNGMPMKKVLVITYYWPPSGGGGVQRWLKFVKYLRSFGWEPVVYTPSNPEMPSEDPSLLREVPQDVLIVTSKIWEPYSFYKKFTGKKQNDKIQTAFLTERKSKYHFLEDFSVWVRGNFFIPDARKFWIKPSVKKLSQFLQGHPIDALVTTGPPHSMHLIGMRLKEKFGIPWLADFRDPWTNIDFYNDLKLKPGNRADRKHHFLEKQVLQKADAITVVSRGMKEDFKAIVGRDYAVIPNGYDAEDLQPQKEPVPENSRFVLAHIGSLTRTRNAENLWKVLKELTGEYPDFAEKLLIKNVGKIDLHVLESLKKFGLEEHLQRIDYIPHDKVIAEQRKASVLLLLVNNTPNARLILTGKLFEYLAARRPVICIGPRDGNAAEVVRETGCGAVFGFAQTTSLKEHLVSLFRAFKEGNLEPQCEKVENYERKNLTARLAGVLDDIVRNS